MGLSFLFGLNTVGYKCVEEELKKVINAKQKVAVIPWALAPHDDKEHVPDDYFPKNGRRYEREIAYLREFGADDEFNGTIIGGSAGATSQFERYFITSEQSFYGVLQECDGIDIIKSDFMIDVHTNQYTTEKSEEESARYMQSLEALSRKYKCLLVYRER